MKQLISALSVLLLLVFSATAQTTNPSFSVAMNPPYGCLEGVDIHFLIGEAGESLGIVTIDWGDGDSTIQTYSLPYDSLYFEHGSMLQHRYADTGTYLVHYSLYSTTSGQYVAQGNLLIYSDVLFNCGYIFNNTFSVNGNLEIHYSDVPLDITDSSGIVSTVYPDDPFNALYTGFDVRNAPYTIAINQAWLDANNLEQISPNIELTALDSAGTNGPTGYSLEVGCLNFSEADLQAEGFVTEAFIAPLEMGAIRLSLCNQGCYDSVTVANCQLIVPSNVVIDFTSVPGATQTGNTIAFQLTDIPNGCQYFDLPVSFPGNTPAGTALNFIFQVNAANDPVWNNSDTITAIVLNSYDPNNKLVDHSTEINAFNTDVLEYTINFQNEGNFPALNVVLRDTIAENLDLSSFTFIGSRHPVYYSIDHQTREVVFRFSNISLAPASQDEEGSKGFVVYSIRENADLPIGTEIENTAYIYFDFNPAIITNTTYNVNEVLATTELNGEALVMYPNPAATHIYFSGATVQEVRVFDMAGKTVLHAAQPLNNQLEVTALNNGLYQVQLITENGVYSQKLMIRK